MNSRFEADFLWKVNLNILNKAGYKSFADLFPVYLRQFSI